MLARPKVRIGGAQREVGRKVMLCIANVMKTHRALTLVSLHLME